jgi:hypothetical protein
MAKLRRLQLKSSPSVGGFLGDHPRLLPKKARIEGWP